MISLCDSAKPVPMACPADLSVPGDICFEIYESATPKKKTTQQNAHIYIYILCSIEAYMQWNDVDDVDDDGMMPVENRPPLYILHFFNPFN